MRSAGCLLVSMLATLGCGEVVDDEPTESVHLALHQTPEGDVVRRWVEHGLDAVRNENIGTPDAARLYAMLTIAMYDAVNGIDRANGGGRQHAMVEPIGAPRGARRDAAAMGAAHAVLILLVPNQAATLHRLRDEERAAMGSSSAVTAGESWGVQVGHQVVARRNQDGTQSAVIIPAGTAPGAFRASFDARWANMIPFGIQSKAPYVSPAPPALTSSAYTVAFNEVKALGDPDGDPTRNEISTFWLVEGGTGREPGAWVQAALAIAQQEGTINSISRMARLFALVGMAVADAVPVSWETKRLYFRWRPTTAIREANTDGNPNTVADPAWTSRTGSVGGTPEYTSGLSTFSGAASRVIELFYGNSQLDFCFQTELAPQPRCYASVLAAAVEAGRSRIFQGIHFEFSNVAGRVAGRALGTEIGNNRLR
jgi:hypothetical protein